MAYSVQIYKAYLSKTPAQIRDILEQEKKHHRNSLAKITKVGPLGDDNLVRLSLTIKASSGDYFCDITINQSRKLLLVQAPAHTRFKINKFLAQVIENDDAGKVIHSNDLSIDQSLELFKRIANEDKDNIIEILTIHFEPELGYKYEKEIYTELSYRFIQNRCASEHKDFRKLCKSGERVTMRLSISKCRDLVRYDTMALVIKPESSFRMWADIKPEVWDDFCFEMGYVASD